MKTNVLKLKAAPRDDPFHAGFLSLLTKGPIYCTFAPRLLSSIKTYSPHFCSLWCPKAYWIRKQKLIEK